MGPPKASGRSRGSSSCCRSASSSGNRSLLSDSSGFEYYKHVDEVAKERQLAKQTTSAPRLRRPWFDQKRMNHDVQKLETSFKSKTVAPSLKPTLLASCPTRSKTTEVVLKGQLHGQRSSRKQSDGQVSVEISSASGQGVIRRLYYGAFTITTDSAGKGQLSHGTGQLGGSFGSFVLLSRTLVFDGVCREAQRSRGASSSMPYGMRSAIAWAIPARRFPRR